MPTCDSFYINIKTVCRCCSHLHLGGDRMPPRWPEELGLRLRRHVDETRVPKRHQPDVQEEDRGDGPVGWPARGAFFSLGRHAWLRWSVTAAFCVQAAGHVGAGGGNHAVSFLRLPAASERAAVHLLQEQPALLHRHGNLHVSQPIFSTLWIFFFFASDFFSILGKRKKVLLFFQGRHMLKEDWSVCPHCEFPALYSQFIL